MERKLAVIGGGNMGSALIGGLVKKEICSPSDILVCEVVPERREQLARDYGVRVSDLLEKATGFARTVLLAVKPMHLPEVGSRLQSLLGQEHVLISILAGQSRQKLASVLGDLVEIVRVMPNLPAQVQAGISSVTFSPNVQENVRSWVNEILSAVGPVVEVEEELQDAVTAVSGSGPGYLFYLVDQMIAAAKEAGLPDETARLLVLHTFAGAGRYLEQSSEDPAVLVKRVATPGGTTEAGLNVLGNARLPEIVSETIRKATERSKELGQA